MPRWVKYSVMGIPPNMTIRVSWDWSEGFLEAFAERWRGTGAMILPQRAEVV